MPESPPSGDGMLAQILLKQGEMSVQLAVISEQLKVLPDHEARIRALERFRWTLAGLAIAAGALSGYVGYIVGHGH